MLKALTNAKNISMVNNITVALFTFLGVCAVFIWFYRLRYKDDLNKRNDDFNKLTYKLLFVIAAVIGISVRLWRFGTVPGGFNYDEAMAALDGNAIAKYGTDHYGMSFPAYFQAWKGGQQSIMMGYLMAPVIKIFGMNVYTVRIPILIMSIIGGIFLVLLVKDMFGQKCALAAAFLVAMSPWHMMQSRWALDANMLPHFFIIALYFLNKGIKTRKRYLYVSMVLFALCMYCYAMAVYSVTPFLALMAIYLLVSKKIKLKELILAAGIFLVISLPFFACLIINFLKLDTIKIGFLTIPRFYETQREADMIFFSAQPYKSLIQNLKSLYNVLILQKFDLPNNSIQGFGSYFYCGLPLMILGLLQLFVQKNKSAAVILLCAIISGVFSGLITEASTSWRIAIMFYTVIILMSLGFTFIISQFGKWSFASIAVYGVVFVMFISSYFTTYAKQMETYFFKGFGEALDYMETLDVDKYYITAESQHKTSKVVSETYTLFYHNIDPHYYQGVTNINNGKELLPYSQRYTYSNISQADIKENENAAYLITTDEKKYFDENKYNFKPYSGVQVNYLVVTQK